MRGCDTDRWSLFALSQEITQLSATQFEYINTTSVFGFVFFLFGFLLFFSFCLLSVQLKR